MANKRTSQRPINTYIEIQLFEAFDEVAWRKHMNKTAATTQAFEEFILKPIEDPPVIFPTPKPGPGYRQVTTYVELQLFSDMHDAKWRRPRGTTITGIAAQAIRDFVENYRHIPTPR